MKKIVGILGMAAVLASAAFAADPAANFVMSEFTGSYEFGVKGNFAKKDAEFGMYNTPAASLKFGFVTAGDKITTGDGVWGELKIKNDASDATAIPAAAVDTAKIHFVDGDFSMAMNLVKPSLVYGGFTPASATPIVAAKKTDGVDGFAGLRKTYSEALDKAKKAEVYTKAVEAEKKAKEALAKATNDTYEDLLAAYDIAAKALKTQQDIVDGLQKKLDALPKAGAGSTTGLATAGIGKDGDLKAGFGLEMKLDGLFAFNLKFMDKGLDVAAKDQKYGLAFDASLLAVENLEASVAMSMNFGIEYTGLQAKAAYNFAIDDKLYVKPAVTYEMTKTGSADAANALAAGLLFGWGAKDSETTLDYFGKYKYNEGVSVALCPIFQKDNTDFLMTVGFYDQSVLSLLGDPADVGTLKTAFGFDTYINKDAAVNTIRAALAYDVTFSPVYLSAHFGMDSGAMGKNAEFKPSIKFGVKLGSKEIIDNTDLYVSYEMEKAGDADKLKTNELVIGSKISF